MQLSNIVISHISLVKSGANGKTVIYKSDNKTPKYENIIPIKKSDKEEGIIYGIVYSPDEIDSQGDIATAEEIKKASYLFMQNRNTGNVDIEHSFSNTDAFVAESWIVKSNDAVFPDEKIGAWAVGIKLESDELKELVKKGEITGLSMAGEAIKKAESSDDRFKKFFSMLAEVVDGFSMDFYTRVSKSSDEINKAKEIISKSLGTEKIKELKDEILKLKLLNAELIKKSKQSKQIINVHKKTEKKESNIEGVL